MFLVCDPIVCGIEHVPFNTALLNIIRLAFPDDDISFYGEESHLYNVQKHLGLEYTNSITWEKLVLPSRHSSFRERLLSDFKITKFLLNKLNKDPQKHVLVISGNSSILWALKFFVHTVHKDKNIQVILHGGLSALVQRRSLRPFRRIGDIRTALRRFNHRNLQYIVLEKSIRDAVLRELPFLREHIDVLDHPIPLDDNPKETNVLNPPIQFGFLGLATKHKGFLKFIDVASEISAEFPGLANFHVIGRVGRQYDYLNMAEMDFLSTTPGNERLSRDEYARLLNKLHFICLFCEDRYYEFSASGVLLDAIAWEKPVIATRLLIFKNIEREFGDIGYLCKNGEFSEIIRTILKEMNRDRYKCQVLNISRVKKSRTPESLAKYYRNTVEKIRIK
ncbi:MAG: glycosyltransferase [Candidatus Scalindua sp.]|nr:glycosyltransferase [Candidatus Scalindua sp.]